MCIQVFVKSTRDYLTRWAEVHNSCEGVHEVQAIEYFIAGCKKGTVLKQKLMCDEPTTLDELLVVAAKYTTTDSSMKLEIWVDTSGKVIQTGSQTPAGDTSWHQQPNDSKRKSPASGFQQPASGRCRGSAAGLAAWPQASAGRQGCLAAFLLL